MSKDNAIIFLSEESLEALESSKGVIHLITFPRLIEENNAKITELEAKRAGFVSQMEEEKNLVNGYSKLPWIKRITKKAKETHAEHTAKLGELARIVADFDSEIGELFMENRNMTYAYNQFVKALANINIEPQDVIDEYHRIKDMLEKKARGEWVEPTIETPAVHEEAPAKVEVAPVREEPIAQNSKKVQRLSPREKFERRLAITAQKQAQNAQKAKQPGEE